MIFHLKWDHYKPQLNSLRETKLKTQVAEIEALQGELSSLRYEENERLKGPESQKNEGIENNELKTKVEEMEQLQASIK